MTTKQTSTPASKRRAVPALSRAAGMSTESAHAMPVFELSFDVEPVVSIVRRHVKLSKEADEAIKHELTEMLGRAVVQLRTTGHKTPARRTMPVHQDDQVLTTEQAAQLAGVSRPYMAKLIDTGAVALHQMVGNQRRVLRSTVARWQATERTRQTKALKRLGQEPLGRLQEHADLSAPADCIEQVVATNEGPGQVLERAVQIHHEGVERDLHAVQIIGRDRPDRLGREKPKDRR
ncbi:helix-turn-helix domain-containing protein [Achromobacter aloeverae]